MLLKAVQGQQDEIDRMQAEVRRVNRLETRLAELQVMLRKSAPHTGALKNVLAFLMISSGGIFLYSRRTG